MKLSTSEVVEAVAKELAHGTDEEQGAFLNAFFSELHVATRGDRNNAQLCYLSDRLTPRTSEGVKTLAEFVVLREKESKQAVAA